MGIRSSTKPHAFQIFCTFYSCISREYRHASQRQGNKYAGAIRRVEMSVTYVGQAIYEWTDGRNREPRATVSRFGGIFDFFDYVGFFRLPPPITLGISSYLYPLHIPRKKYHLCSTLMTCGLKRLRGSCHVPVEV